MIEKDPDQVWTHGATWALSLKLKDILEKPNLREEELIFWWGKKKKKYEREQRGRERKKENIPTFFLRSLEFCCSEFIESRVKVHLLDEGYAWVPKRRGFTEDPREEISGNQNFRDYEVFLRPPSVLLRSKR